MRVAQRAVSARTCAPLALAHRLAEWVGEGRPVTPGRVLTVRDAAEAIHVLGLRPPGDVPELDVRQQTLFNGGSVELFISEPAELLHGGSAQLSIGGLLESSNGGSTATRDLARRSAELTGAWNIAMDVAFIEMVRERVQQGPALADWPGGSDGEVLAVWRDAFTSVLSLRLEHGEDTPDELAAVFPLIMEILYEAGGTVPGALSLLELRDQLVARAGRRVFGGDDYWDRVRRCGLVLGHAVARLDEIGAVAVERDIVRLTPLGSWGWGEEIIRQNSRWKGPQPPSSPPVEPVRRR